MLALSQVLCVLGVIIFWKWCCGRRNDWELCWCHHPKQYGRCSATTLWAGTLQYCRRNQVSLTENTWPVLSQFEQIILIWWLLPPHFFTITSQIESTLGFLRQFSQDCKHKFNLCTHMLHAELGEGCVFPFNPLAKHIWRLSMVKHISNTATEFQSSISQTSAALPIVLMVDKPIKPLPLDTTMGWDGDNTIIMISYRAPHHSMSLALCNISF